jgi:thiamine-monophosphate kinase
MNEFDIIREYLSDLGPKRADVVLDVGDDCALLASPADRLLALSIDTLVEGRHFLAQVDPADLGHKALAVNLSDLAAMGAEPAWVTLALTLPQADRTWIEPFVRGFSGLAQAHGLRLVGGDTTKGPRSITVQVHGFVEPGRALRRDGARAGDLIYVSGTLGDAGLALLARQGLYVDSDHLQFLAGRLDRPTPRLELGRSLAQRGLASAAIDLSDGLGSDLRHICRASGVGARLHLAQLPVSAAVGEYLAETGDWSVPASSGDDYELCFTVPERRQAEVEALAAEMLAECDLPLTWIGMVEARPGLRAVYPDGSESDDLPGGFDHFAGEE